MTRLFVLALLLCVSACVRTGGSSTGDSTASASARDDVLRAQQERFSAMTRNDLAALERILGDDLTYTHSSGVLDGKAAYLASLRSGAVRYVAIEPRDVQARVFGDAAVVNGEARLDVRVQGSTQESQLRFTEVYVRRDGRWQLAAWQSTRLPG